ncbi:MAG: TPM domain-containing protein [Candidatus Omnitrophota bacterium]|nr:TPM domain-containing protein [Candidatus Omnitrophota bacterium]
MKKIITGFFIILFCSAVFSPGVAEEIRSLSPTGFVNDYAGVLSPGARAEITVLSEEVERKTGVEMVVVTVNTTAPLTVEQYAVDLYQKWGIGKKGEDNGILLLLAVKDRKIRIEVGYGLEGAVTDLKCKIIINDLMVPALKKGGYDLGISSGVVMLAKIIREEYGVELELGARGPDLPAARPKRSPLGSLLTLLFFMLIFGLRFGTFFFLMSGGGGYWSRGGGGSFGGGFGGFGGGMSGGGGASGSW